MYLIQLFNENIGSCASGVTNVYVDDIEDFSKKYISVETKNIERVNRFLRSKAGEIVTDYYSDSPDYNIVTKVEAQDVSTKIYYSQDKTITLLNGYMYESVYYFGKLFFTTKYIKYDGKFYKLMKTSAFDCCHRNPFVYDKPWQKVYINGNKFWFYKDGDKTPYSAQSTGDFRGTSVETFVWHTADVFDNEEDMKSDMEITWPTDLQIVRVLKDLPGDAG